MLVTILPRNVTTHVWFHCVYMNKCTDELSYRLYYIEVDSYQNLKFTMVDFTSQQRWVCTTLHLYGGGGSGEVHKMARVCSQDKQHTH